MLRTGQTCVIGVMYIDICTLANCILMRARCPVLQLFQISLKSDQTHLISFPVMVEMAEMKGNEGK